MVKPCREQTPTGERKKTVLGSGTEKGEQGHRKEVDSHTRECNTKQGTRETEADTGKGGNKETTSKRQRKGGNRRAGLGRERF